MDGLVLWEAIGLRSSGGDGLTEWIAVGIAAGALIVMCCSFVAMFFFSSFVILSFVSDTNAKRRILAKQTTDHAGNLEFLLDSFPLSEVRNLENINRVKKIGEHFKEHETPQKEHLDYFIELYDQSLHFLSSLEATYYLIEKNAISKSLLKSCVGGRLLREYELFFEPLLQVREVLIKKIPDDDPMQRYYTGTWHGIPKLIEMLEELIQKGEEEPRGKLGRLKKYVEKQLLKI